MSEFLQHGQKVICVDNDTVMATTMKWLTLRAWWSPKTSTQNLIVIDHGFRLYRVKDVVRPKPKPGWFHWVKSLLAPVYHVDLVFDGPPQQSSLEECRELIYQTMELDPDFYESSRPMEEWKDDLWAAQTFEELYILIRCAPGDYAHFQGAANRATL